jgi:hypothetical protein
MERERRVLPRATPPPSDLRFLCVFVRNFAPLREAFSSAIRDPRSAIRDPPSAIRHALSAIRYPLSAIRYPLSALSPLTTSNQQPATTFPPISPPASPIVLVI